MVIIQRIIRQKGLPVANLTEGTKVVENIGEAIKFAVSQKKVYVYLDENGNEGIIRSGRKMRTVDLHVRNTVSSGIDLVDAGVKLLKKGIY